MAFAVWFFIILISILIVGVVLISQFIRQRTGQSIIDEIGPLLEDQLDAQYSNARIEQGNPVEGDSGRCRVLVWRDGDITFNRDDIEDGIERGRIEVQDEPPACLLPHEYQMREINIRCTRSEQLANTFPDAPDTCVTREGDRLHAGESTTMYVSCGGVPTCAQLFAQVQIGDRCMTMGEDEGVRLPLPEPCEPIDQFTDRLASQLFIVRNASEGPDITFGDGDGSQARAKSLPDYFYLGIRGDEVTYVGGDRRLVSTSSGEAFVFSIAPRRRIFEQVVEGARGQPSIEGAELPTTLSGFRYYTPVLTNGNTQLQALLDWTVMDLDDGYRLMETEDVIARRDERTEVTIRTVIPYDTQQLRP